MNSTRVEGDAALPRRSMIALGLVLAATVAVYLPSIRGAFVFDDLAILEEPLVRAPARFASLATWASGYRPLATLTYALDHAAFGFSPLGWHVTSLLGHLLASLLAFWFVRRTLERAGAERPDAPAVAAAALFALHPLQTESVTYLWQRAESLAAVLYLGALLVLLASDDAESPGRRWGLRAGALGLQLLALLAKPMAATLPLAWALHRILLPGARDAARAPGQRARRALIEALPGVAVSLLVGAGALSGVEGERAGLMSTGADRLRYLATQLVAVPTYLRLLILPVGQSVDHPVPDPARDLMAMAVGSLVLLTLAAATAVQARRVTRTDLASSGAGRTTLFAAAWFAVLLAPASGLVPLRDAIVEHRMYLPLLACGLALAAALAARPGRTPVLGRRRWIVAALVLAALAGATAARNMVWRTPLELWTDAAEKAPDKARPNLNLGLALFEAGRPREALRSLRHAWSLRTDGSIPPAGINGALLGALVGSTFMAGTEAEAVAVVQEALAATPDDPEALVTSAQLAAVQGQPEAAARAAQRALERSPGHAGALSLLGGLRLEAGDAAGARDLLSRAVARNPADGYAWLKLAEAAAGAGDYPAACTALAQVVALPSQSNAAAAQAGRNQLQCR
jgi:protein O-mannosyl-transferase